MKRHHFRGGAAAHGSMFHRAPGGIGPSAYPSRVFPGTRMAGRMGCDRGDAQDGHGDQGRPRAQPALPQGRRAWRPRTRWCAWSRRRRGPAMKIDVRNWDNEVVGRDGAARRASSRIPSRPHLVYEVVKAYLAGLRRGTHMPPRTARSVSGGGKKPWKQKGTGRARVGSTRSPLWRHGGTVFGPQPRSLRGQGQHQGEEERAQVGPVRARAEGRACACPRVPGRRHPPHQGAPWRAWARLGLTGRKVLFVDSYENLNLMLATRNRPELTASDALHLHVYHVLAPRAAWCSRAGRWPARGGADVMKDPRQIIVRPIVTEKTADAKEHSNTVCFEVARSANGSRSARPSRRCSTSRWSTFGLPTCTASSVASVVSRDVARTGARRTSGSPPARRRSNSSIRCKGAGHGDENLQTDLSGHALHDRARLRRDHGEASPRSR